MTWYECFERMGKVTAPAELREAYDYVSTCVFSLCICTTRHVPRAMN
jgi:hypothetical protein